jgi:transposase
MAVDSGIAPLRRFATGLRDDYAAVMAGLSTNYSNGPTEGQITKIKALRRAMYGRGRFDLVRQRVLHAA